MNDMQQNPPLARDTKTNGATKAPLWRVTPELDLYESDTEYLLQLDVPSASPDTLKVQVLGNTLQIHAEGAPADHGADVARMTYERTVQLPAEVDAASATAQLRNGILEIRIAKSAAARRVRIPVRMN
jgi:HSP20 family protein